MTTGNPNPNTVFSLSEFITEARSVLATKRDAHEKQAALRELLVAFFTENRVAQAKAMLDVAAGDSTLSESILHSDEELSLVYIQLPPKFQSGIFDHATTHVVSMTLQGVEGNTFYKESDGTLERVREEDVAAGLTIVVPPDVIRSVENKSRGNDDTTLKVLVCFLGDIRELNKKRHVYVWNQHTSGKTTLPYSFQALVEQGLERMKVNGNMAGIQSLKDQATLGQLATTPAFINELMTQQ